MPFKCNVCPYSEVIQPNMPPEACVDSNDFRRNRLYFEEMDLLYDKHLRTLKAGWYKLHSFDPWLDRRLVTNACLSKIR